ncbi:MAG: GT-D fold domain-containing glycosyltransferase [Mobilitalea sp.]
MLIRKVKSLGEKVTSKQLDQLKQYEKEYPRVMSTNQTLNMIIEKGYSIARFGDAEFDICNQENKDDPYQRPSNKLSLRLINILNSKSDNILVCIPPFNSRYNNPQNYYGKLSFWEWYWLKKFTKIRPILKRNEYGNSFVSRDCVFYENDLSIIRKIWDSRDVVFVYGENGRFELSNIIFNNIRSFKELTVPPVSAFDNYDEILEKCKMIEKTNLFLIAAGPMATVLAYDLSQIGYQALDIGHLPNCYNQYVGKIDSPEAMPLVKTNSFSVKK